LGAILVVTLVVAVIGVRAAKHWTPWADAESAQHALKPLAPYVEPKAIR
jgi:hypothetical protein